MKNPNNQNQQVIWYLYNYKKLTMKFIITDSLFWKFNTRLSEIENKLGFSITHKKRVEFINKFGRNSTYLEYSKSVPRKKLLELFKIYR